MSILKPDKTELAIIIAWSFLLSYLLTMLLINYLTNPYYYY